ncbi:MAG: NAD(P)H-hydrate dehydratase [Candidatus Aminicenantes bacterium]|nr:NAD(P)H-hydrate dehydratase [Candidatus Aminicenantes bacterium]
MKVLTSIQMKEIDRKTIEGIGIPGPVLMENAGIRITQAILKRFPEAVEQNIVVVAGKGNNGGDGFVVARHLFNMGARPTVLLLAKKEDVKGDAALNLAVADRIGVKIVEVPTEAEWKKRRMELWHASLIVDAIFGTGLLKPAEGIYAAAIEDINKSKAFKVAVDIPSGLSSDTHLIIGPAVKADLTVALAAPKIGHVLPPAEEFVGELVVADISVPPFLFDDPALKIEFVEKTTVAPYFKKRKKDSHKGSYGHLFVLAGSLGKTGAVVMAGKAALRTGTGLVTIGTPQSCLPAIANSMMELMTEALPETPQKTLSESAIPLILDLMKGKDAVLIGPGISTHPSTARLVTSLLPKIKVPVVIDADGLNILAAHPDALKSLPKPAVLTPHPGEFGRLIGRSNRDVLDHRLELASRFSEQFGVYLVLKGYRTLIATPEGRVFINPTGNPGMATGGSGDVLSGMIASLIIQEKDVLGATLAAVYLHGLSGDIGARILGERALIAGDLIKYLPKALKEMES